MGLFDLFFENNNDKNRKAREQEMANMYEYVGMNQKKQSAIRKPYNVRSGLIMNTLMRKSNSIC